MTSTDQAKKGFKTFVLTLSVSLIVFSVIYYLLTGSENTSDSELLTSESSTVQKENAPSVAGVTESSPFGGLAKKELIATTIPTNRYRPVPAVLADTDTTTTTVETGLPPVPVPQTTVSVPDGGVLEVTIGLLLSVFIFGIAFYWNKLNPRRLAMTNFEQRIIEDLNREDFNLLQFD